MFLCFQCCTLQEVEETPAKRGRRGKEPSVNQSPSLQRGKSSTENSPRIMFTGLYDKQGERVSSFLMLLKRHYGFMGTFVFFLDQGNVQFVDHSKLEYLPDYGCQL